VPWEETKIRVVGESKLVEREGTDDSQTPTWYDETPEVGIKIISWGRPWTFAGDLKVKELPQICGLINKKGKVASFGYMIRVSTSVKGWERKHSDFVYIDCYEVAEKKVTTIRFMITQFNADFAFVIAKALEPYEQEQQQVLCTVLDKCKESRYSTWITQFDKFVDQYFKVIVIVAML
jgi:hypothetical protein